MSESQEPAAVTYAWGRPLNANKHHIFCGTRSLCGKWLYGGAEQKLDPTLMLKKSPGDCAECVKRFKAVTE